MILETEFKNCKAIQLENEDLRVVVLPYLGGKIASLYKKDKDFELVYQNKEEVYRKAKVYDNFAEFDASGFDDAFPSIDEGMVKFKNNKVLYPDHGEIWTGTFDFNIVGDTVELYFTSTILSYNYKKIIFLNENLLEIKYEIVNTGKENLPCIWAAHYLVNCHEDMELILPESTDLAMNVCKSKHLGEIGDLHSYPITKDCYGNEYRLDKVFPHSANKYEKYYICNPISEGKCGIYYPHKDVAYLLHFDKEKLPYIGFWVTEGGFRGDYNCALEPSNGFYDSIDRAKLEGKLYELRVGENLNFTIGIELI
jgi:galactose mutarotase-like enzyme